MNAETEATYSDEYTFVSSVPQSGDNTQKRRMLRITRKSSKCNVPTLQKQQPYQRPIGLVSKLRSTSRQDLTFIGALLICMYLLNGEYSQFVCNFCLSIPAALLTYHLIVSPNSNVKEMKAMLGYWILFAMLLSLDQFAGKAFGYYSGKFLFSIAALGHVKNKCNKHSEDGKTETEQSSAVQVSGEKLDTSSDSDSRFVTTKQDNSLLSAETFTQPTKKSSRVYKRNRGPFKQKSRVVHKRIAEVPMRPLPELPEPSSETAVNPECVNESDFCDSCQAAMGILH